MLSLCIEMKKDMSYFKQICLLHVLMLTSLVSFAQQEKLLISTDTTIKNNDLIDIIYDSRDQENYTGKEFVIVKDKTTGETKAVSKDSRGKVSKGGFILMNENTQKSKYTREDIKRQLEEQNKNEKPEKPESKEEIINENTEEINEVEKEVEVIEKQEPDEAVQETIVEKSTPTTASSSNRKNTSIKAHYKQSKSKNRYKSRSKKSKNKISKNYNSKRKKGKKPDNLKCYKFGR